MRESERDRERNPPDNSGGQKQVLRGRDGLLAARNTATEAVRDTRGKSALESFDPYLRQVFRETTSYYFTNILNSWMDSDFRKIFAHYGSVGDVFISKRRDKLGKRYGFVRFRNVKDSRCLERQLDNILIRNTKINVNLSKYSGFEGKKESPKIYQSYAAVLKQNPNPEPRNPNVARERREIARSSHRRPLKANGLSRWADWEMSENYGDKWNGLAYSAKQEDMESLNKCYVAEVHNPNEVFLLQEKLFMEGLYSLKVSPMGGNLVLLAAGDEEEIPDLMKDAGDCLNTWFSSIRPWQPRYVNLERIFWIKCQGIPPHAWNPEYFEEIAKQYGRFLMVDDSTSGRRDSTWRES